MSVEEAVRLERGVSRVRHCDGPEGTYVGSWLSGDMLVLVVQDGEQYRRDWWADDCEVVR
ncbi:hypothetical protein ABT369_39000 [Dactylosporangium sp. NPDC000244]|uniref:hypothetical protein n=1 Tax=Dactylosporangium sp. NPDC000244 TaxID=3154365 RepID=UPI0033173AB4